MTGGAIVHSREGSPNLSLAKWLVIGSVPMALLGPYLVAGFTTDEDQPDYVLKMAIGFALLLAASTYALRLYINLRRVRSGAQPQPPSPHPPPPHPARGRPGRSPRRHHQRRVRLGHHGRAPHALSRALRGERVGTDLVQAVPLVMAAAISNIVLNGLDWGLLICLVLSCVPGTIIGSKLAPRVFQSFIRRGIVVVLTMSGVALLDKAGWAPLGVEETHPFLIAGIGLAMIVLVPLVWGVLRKEQGLPMFGAPTVAEEAKAWAAPPPGSALRGREGAVDAAGRHSLLT